MIEKAVSDYCRRSGVERIDLKLFMFDMDGVLFNSMPNHARAWTLTMADFGKVFDEKDIYLHEGRTVYDTVRLFLGPDFSKERCREIYELKCRHFDSLPKVQMMPGAIDVVRAVRSAGKEAIVVTGSGQQKMLSHIDKYYPGLFTTASMVSSDDVVKGKPNPEPYLMGLKKSGNLLPTNAIVIENAPLGVKAGHDAGCFVIAANTGPLPDSMLFEAGADLVYPSMPALSQSIGDILSYIL